MTFRYEGVLPASKSILNRLLVIQSYAEGDFNILGDSSADDVRFMREGLAALAAGRPARCGEAGTVLRFLALRAARISGEHRLLGSPRLFARPQETVLDLLAQLGVAARITADPALVIAGSGWRDPGEPLAVDRSRSSQFASALLLNAWELPFPLALEGRGERVSESYLQLTRVL